MERKGLSASRLYSARWYWALFYCLLQVGPRDFIWASKLSVVEPIRPSLDMGMAYYCTVMYDIFAELWGMTHAVKKKN